MNPYTPPNQPYGVPPAQGYPHAAVPTAEDESHLNTLAICHFVYAGFAALGGLFGVVYAVMGIVVAASVASSPSAGASGAPPPALFGGIFAAIGGIIVVLAWTLAALIVYSGLCLKRRRRRTFSFVMACICCLNVPLGTALGVFTLVVLSRASVKAIYDRVAYYGA
jgi:hypothetical protein